MRNELVAVVVLPVVLTAVAVNTNCCAVPSVHLLCQTVPPSLMLPVTWAPEVRTETSVTLPCAAVTVTPAAGLTLMLPLPGVIVNCAEAGPAGFASPSTPPPEHAATKSRAAAAATAAADLTIGRRWCHLPSLHVRSLRAPSLHVPSLPRTLNLQLPTLRFTDPAVKAV